MGEFYELKRKIEEGDIYIEKYDAPDAYSFDYDKGTPIENPAQPARLYYKSATARKTDLVGGLFSFLVISKRFKELLEGLGTDPLEFHPVRLVCVKTKEADDSYFFLNILDHVECFDWDKSKYKTYPGTKVIKEAKKLVIREDRTGGRNIFRVQELLPFLVVTGRLKALIEAAGLTGIELLPAEKFII